MDPSCTIGFLCSSLEEFHKLREQAEKLLAPPLQKGVYPFFSFSDLCLEQMLDASVNMHVGSLVDDHLLVESSPHMGRDKRKEGGDNLDGLVFCDEEDFVVVECRRGSEAEVPPLDPFLSNEESGGLFAEAEMLSAPTREGVERDTRGGVASVSSPTSGHTAGTGGPQLGFVGHFPGLIPAPPSLDNSTCESDTTDGGFSEPS